MVPIRDEMEKKGELVIQKSTLSDPTMTRKRPVNLRAPNLSVFSGQEIALVDRVLEMCKPAAGAALSRYTHGWHGWIAAQEGETIPYETVFISDDPITPFESARGRELATKHGWGV